MLILHHGHFITCNPEQPVVEALAIEGERIVAIGQNADILALKVPGTKQLNLGDQTVLPGFTDSHIHLEDYALSLNRMNCDTPSKATCLHAVQERVLETPPGQWILGHGWDHNQWGTDFPSIADLDKISPHNPVYLTGKSMHNAWVNHQALELSDIHQNTPDPKGGRIERDPQGGFTGILLDAATLLVEKTIPLPSVNECIIPFKSAIHTLNQMGITSIHDFDEVHNYEVLKQLYNEDSLNLRIFKGIPSTHLDQAILKGWQTGKGDDQIRFGPLKLFADGALGSKTALMIDPYEDDPQDKGLALLSQEELYQIGEKALKANISLAIHAIGDRANRNVINVFGKLRALETKQGFTPASFRIEHLQLIDPADVPLLAKFQITASMQPSHAPSDARMAERLWGKRVNFAYAWRSILESGAIVIFGSDCPVENPNPFWGIHAAVTRQRFGCSIPWHAEQCINVNQALMAYTATPAIVADQGGRLGMIKQGYYADLIFLSSNPFSLPINELYNIKVQDAMLAGKWLFPGQLSTS